jgi:N-acetylneuraminic acid mutarotase
MNRSFTPFYLLEKMLPKTIFLAVFFLLSGFSSARNINFQTIPNEVTGIWQTLAASSGVPIGREENAYVQAGNKFYLIGGRGIRAVQEYNPVTKAWVNKSNVPTELHHFQAVTLDGLIYVVGAFTGSYPREKPVPNVYIYNPTSDQWIEGPAIPASRRRGGAGVVVYNKKIYVIAGILDGHWTGHVKWMDEFDPASNTWKILGDAPHARDHFHAAIINGKIFVAGGRRSSTSTGQTFALTVPEVDVYSFATSSWSTLPAGSNIPTPRAGSGTVALGNELLVIGGESSQPTAHKETEALNVTTNTWRRLVDLKQGRHGTQAIESNNGIYIAVGAGNQGGSPLLSSHEAFYMSTATTPSGQALAQSNLTAPASLAFGQIAVSTSATKPLTLTNSTGNQAIVVSSITKTGDNSFTYSAPFTLPFVIPVGGSVSIQVTFSPGSGGAKSGSLAIKHSGSGQTATISLSGTAGTIGALSSYSINTGGPAITLQGKSWAADNYFVGGKIYTNTKIGDIANTGSDQLFKNERSSATPFGYAFPVVNGTYKVDLHFAEIYWGATGGGAGGTGKRVFSVNLEGGPVELVDFDIFKEAGAMNALAKSFNVTVADGILNIDFSMKTNQPKISAIQISPASDTGNGITATPSALHFFSQQAGTTSAPQTITFSNSGSVSRQISSVTLTGDNQAEFVHNFTNAITISPGSSQNLAVTFKPASLGTKVAQLSVVHSGSATPLLVGLTGEGANNPNQPPVANAGADQTVTVPVVSVTLNGSGSDTDGTVTSYAWSQVSGATVTFSSKTVAKPVLTGFSAGTYIFSLVVNDNLGASSAADQVTITVQSASAQQVTDLILINAGNEQAIQSFASGVTLNLNNLPTNLNIQAVTNPATVGSVKFVLTGAATRNQTETGAPYALFGDTKGDYNNWVPNAGNYTLTATPYTLSNGGGTAGTSRTVNLTFTKPSSGGARAGDDLDALNVSGAEALAEVFPNPATETIHIQVADWQKIRSVSINNSLGIRMFFSEDMEEVSKGISVKEMPAGLYLIQISGIDYRTSTKKIALVR